MYTALIHGRIPSLSCVTGETTHQENLALAQTVCMGSLFSSPHESLEMRLTDS